jgi:hypothetical protein
MRVEVTFRLQGAASLAWSNTLMPARIRVQDAFHDKPNPVFPDGSILVFRAGNIPMRSDEWFMSTQVIDIFSAFLSNASFPPYVKEGLQKSWI